MQNSKKTSRLTTLQKGGIGLIIAAAVLLLGKYLTPLSTFLRGDIINYLCLAGVALYLYPRFLKPYKTQR